MAGLSELSASSTVGARGRTCAGAGAVTGGDAGGGGIAATRGGARKSGPGSLRGHAIAMIPPMVAALIASIRPRRDDFRDAVVAMELAATDSVVPEAVYSMGTPALDRAAGRRAIVTSPS